MCHVRVRVDEKFWKIGGKIFSAVQNLNRKLVLEVIKLKDWYLRKHYSKLENRYKTF